MTKLLRRLAILLGALAAVAVPGAASAAVYCVHYPACPAGGVAKDTVQDAVVAADADAAHDTVRIGSGIFAASSSSPIQPVDILGSGMGATEVDDNFGQFTSGIRLLNGASRVADLSVRLTKERQIGVDLNPGASAQNVKVMADHSLTQENGFTPDTGSDLHSVVVDLGPALDNTGIHDFGGATVSDSTVTSGLGIDPDTNGTIVRRVTVRGTIPLFVIGGTLNIANALLVPHPDNPQSPDFIAAEVKNGNAGENALLNAAELTVVGAGGTGLGIDVWSNTAVNTGTATANISSSLITRVAHSLVRQGKSITETADLNIDHSAYAAGAIINDNGNGALTDKGGNLTTGADPKFVDPAVGDYRLRFDSPLLDKGSPTEPLSSDNPDLSGRSRVRDSDGNGSAVRDIGAYEYQRLAPTAVFALQPDVAQLGQATAFDATQTSDPDGDPLSFAWTFGDGAGGSGAQTSHVFGAPGSYEATLTATDATELSASTTETAGVVAPASPPAPTTPTGASPEPALTLSGLSESAKRWLAGAKLARMSRTGPPRGTTFRFSLNRAARVRLAFTQKRNGHKVSRGTLRIAAHAGANQVRFQGRISRTRTLKAGRYTVIVSATDSAGQRSLPHKLTFTIVKP